MRIFSTDSAWDAIEKQWYEVFFINRQEVSPEDYFMELEAEQVEPEEDIIDSNCNCCNCPDQCDEFHCTCGENEEELLDGEEHYEECQCPDCQEHRKMVYLAEAVTHMFRNELCPECVFEMLQDIYDKANGDGFEEGYRGAREEMQDFLKEG